MIVCETCGDVAPEDCEFWLNRDGVTRCPHHVTEWALRQAGVPRSKSTWTWVRNSRRAWKRSELGYATPWFPAALLESPDQGES